ncbi:AraC family transcriptional regulator [Agrobacterium sp. CCNWLW71]|uniref:AraC family transcriptional regulator n=1 Tax=unclassified Agrobacterium TaxID=2632611 RepID=UPI002FF1BF3B
MKMTENITDRTRMDALSDILSVLDVEGMLSARIEASGEWSFEFPLEGFIKFGAVTGSECWIQCADSTEPTHLCSGDFYLLFGAASYRISTDPDLDAIDGMSMVEQCLGDDGVIRYGDGSNPAVLIGARFDVDPDSRQTLQKLLPSIIHVPHDCPGIGALKSVLGLIGEETNSALLGSAVVSSSLSRIALVNVLRSASHRDALLDGGWLKAISDPKIGVTLSLIHNDVNRSWTLATLAAAAGMSRTSFSQRFKSYVDMTPMEYFMFWRMEQAKNALKKTERNLSSIAIDIGYESESAFSSAFKRAVGLSPREYRQRNQP